MSTDDQHAFDELDQLALGQLTPEDARRVEALALSSPLLQAHLADIRARIEKLSRNGAVPPPPHVKDEVMLRIAQLHRFDPGRPPILHAASRVEDFAFWIDRPEMVEDPANTNIFFLPFSDNEQGLSALVWMRDGAEEETHVDVVERFLVIEGQCEIRLDGKVHTLVPGGFMSIPLYTPHTVVVTSDVPCKIIVQRLAA